MNEHTADQLYLDLRTGRPTTIHLDACGDGLRAACTALNRRRTRGIQALSRQIASRKPLSVDVWAALLAGNAITWDVPLISLKSLGIHADRDGIQYSPDLIRLGTGAEATAWLDQAASCVYKTFDLRSTGALGKTIHLEPDEDRECRVATTDATLEDTLEKLMILHEAGACHTEIIGLADSGDFLLVKQPQCKPFNDFDSDQSAAAIAIKALSAKGLSARGFWVFWHNDQPWCLGDLHKGNIMRTEANEPTIIDALVGLIPPTLLKQLPILKFTVDRARQWTSTGFLSEHDPFAGINDYEL
ncbi:hypothetical protein FEM03_19780 [Phragmitibacter flavus]|uniref:Uncharacterized protein n=1 Tax=Phragmitibacter flavus TaxID=2576071 RepID=A0A5R8KAG0_9BACT|nr:hypothetical protein [Phragmitibacter flavus]TLD68905.1 hypothetical protein FEM03_19780 [Phragmitibacter flavus]